MAYFPFLETPVSAESPCGTDLDEDPASQSFYTVLESNLPATYLDFDRKSFDDKAIIAQITAELKKSRDVRLLVLAMKTFALAENLPGFFESLKALAHLIETHWDDAHPRNAGDNFALRSAYIQSLEDRVIQLPLQAAALIKDKRLGGLSYRSFLVAQKPSMARDGETAHDESTLNDAFMRFEPLADLVALHDQCTEALEHFTRLRSIFVDKIGYEAAPKFDYVPSVLKEVVVRLKKYIVDRTPTDALTAPPDTSPEGEAPTPDTADTATAAAKAGELASVREAAAALGAISAYYAANEPSSPAKLLVRQAQQLVGKSFVEAMLMLAPNLLDATKIDIASDTPFSLNFAQLQTLAEADQPAVEEEAAPLREFSIKTRHEATELMKMVERFYRRCEPSSPIPLLLDRARKFVARDFASLLAEMAKQPQ
jgi:type VI secretion system protein ImpA